MLITKNKAPQTWGFMTKKEVIFSVFDTCFVPHAVLIPAF
jgi:hypothetical protein